MFSAYVGVLCACVCVCVCTGKFLLVVISGFFIFRFDMVYPVLEDVGCWVYCLTYTHIFKAASEKRKIFNL